ncbi:hypothetical protein CV944_02585 [Geobacillus sp. WSUCF-018B]|nr:hypothetical protein CV944_02585 [Geobacillus sp. WSUCF-018B]
MALYVFLCSIRPPPELVVLLPLYIKMAPAGADQKNFKKVGTRNILKIEKWFSIDYNRNVITYIRGIGE